MGSKFNEEKVVMSPRYMQLIENLHSDKLIINDAKLKTRGSINIDDHGYIPYPDFTFTADYFENDGFVCGAREIGHNFKRLLNEVPKYINRNSALASCWIGHYRDYIKVGWKDKVPEYGLPERLQKIIDKYYIKQSGYGGMNHCCPDLGIGYKLGWQGILDQIRYYREFNHPSDTSFYDGEELMVLGIIEWVDAHSQLAYKLAENESDEFHRQNYLEIARINRKLTTQPPETLREACQFIAHFQSVDRMYSSGGAGGCLDTLLQSYFERDIASGLITEDEAVWYIASVYFNDTHYYQIGGLIPDGSRDVTSRISFVALDAMHLLGIPVNLALRVHPDCNETLLRRSVEYIIEDGSGVCFSLEKGICDGFANNGYPIELGRMRAKTGCNWVAIPGREYPLQDVTRLNMPMALHYAIEDIKTEGAYSTSRLWDLFSKHLSIMVQCIKDCYDLHVENVSKVSPEIVIDLLMHGPIERGINSVRGGVDIRNFNIDGIGLATVADSFAAIEQRIEKEGRLTWERLFELIDSNFHNAENERLMLNNIMRFGNPSSLAEKWAVRVKDEFVYQCKHAPTAKHKLTIIPGLFSHGDIYNYGKFTPANPNGRKLGEPISHSSEPDPGFAKGLHTFSPVLKANAVAITQTGYGNSAPLHLDIDTGLINSVNGIDAIITLIKVHEQMGGTLINMNCVSKQMLMEAHEDPTKHPDLVVRVTGYSAFFASLSKEYRQQIIDRFLEE